MWLLPVLSALCWTLSRIFYRLQVDGSRVPTEGPVLLVANHPNSLVDPIVVAGTAGRPIRFLAKAPLFADAKLRWLVKAAGAIPVYRKQDDPTAMGRNRDAFEAVFEELSKGAAIGIFPEGISHSDPSLAEIKTGAARIAMGAYERTEEAFPIVPVGIVPERKQRFRSEMRTVIGQPIVWEDLAGRGTEDRQAVAELTSRIEEGLRGVTLNLERWEDRPLVETAESIWALEMGEAEGAAQQINRFEITTRILSAVRRGSVQRWTALARDLDVHFRRLTLLRLRPADLHADTTLRSAVRWSARRLYLTGSPVMIAAFLGFAIFLIPRYATGALTAKMDPTVDAESTYKLLLAMPIYAAWILALSLAGIVLSGLWTGLALLVLLPAIGIVSLGLRERWRWAASDVRRFVTLRSRRLVIDELCAEQERLSRELGDLFDAWEAGDLH